MTSNYRYSDCDPQYLYAKCDEVFNSYSVTKAGDFYEFIGSIRGIPYLVTRRSIAEALAAALRLTGL